MTNRLIDDPFFWGVLGLVVVAILSGLRAMRINIALRERIDQGQQATAAVEAERDQVRAQFATAQRDITALRAERAQELAAARQEAEDAIRAVLQSAARKIQGHAEEQQLIIDQAQKEFGDDPRIVALLMKIDHVNSQIARRTQGTALICGGWLGRREEATSVFDVARAAKGRISDYPRININARASDWVKAEAVEPAAAVLAELMANAARFSGPDTTVDVDIQPVDAGVVVRVDDAGVGMQQEDVDRATALLVTDGLPELTALGDPPKFGFAISGLLARQFGFKVSVDSISPYGGVRAVVLLPAAQLTKEPAPPARHQPTDAGEPMPVRRTDAAEDEGTPVEDLGTTEGGLPRRRRIGAVRALPPLEPAEQQIEPDESAAAIAESAAAIAAFGQGTRTGRESTSTEGR